MGEASQIFSQASILVSEKCVKQTLLEEKCELSLAKLVWISLGNHQKDKT